MSWVGMVGLLLGVAAWGGVIGYWFGLRYARTRALLYKARHVNALLIHAEQLKRYVKVNESILTLLTSRQQRAPVEVNWELLRDAVNGAGYLLVKGKRDDASATH